MCAKGTNLLIPLPGPISAEDMAITGAGARLHSQDASTLSLLYDFEEVEGELDFLTRVVALTFYPALSERSLVTLGEVGKSVYVLGFIASVLINNHLNNKTKHLYCM